MDKRVEAMARAIDPTAWDKSGFGPILPARATFSIAAAKRTLTALEQAGYAVEMDWQPIETAPRDGTRFLAFEGARESQIYECWWQDNLDEWSGWQDHWDSEPAPTHWKPKPLQPAMPQAAKEESNG